MPIYFFNVIRNGISYPDAYELELIDLDEARARAKALLPELIRGEPPPSDFSVVACRVRDIHQNDVYLCRLTLEGQTLPHPDG